MASTSVSACWDGTAVEGGPNMAEPGASPSPHKSTALHFLQANCMLLTGWLGRQRLLHLLPQVIVTNSILFGEPFRKKDQCEKEGL